MSGHEWRRRMARSAKQVADDAVAVHAKRREGRRAHTVVRRVVVDEDAGVIVVVPNRVVDQGAQADERHPQHEGARDCPPRDHHELRRHPIHSVVLR